VFERFTDRARRVVVLSQEEARLLDHNHIGADHLLLGLIHEGEGAAAQALAAAGVTLEGARGHIERIVGKGGSGPVSGHIPFTPEAKRTLELSLREALQLGHNYIGTEHILLGLLRVDDNVAIQVLSALGTDAGAVEEQLVQVMARTSPVTGRLIPEAHGAPPFSPELTAVLADAMAVAEAADAPSVKPEHLVEAAVRQPDGAAARMFRAAGIELSAGRSRPGPLRRRRKGDEGEPEQGDEQR
jgi:ATP-dependent Clp protease ATP-binding subunit ClpC